MSSAGKPASYSQCPIHYVLGREGDVILAGHLHWANVETLFVNVYVAVLDS
jgi:predicted DNA-binding protein with PD1-like motif